MVAFYSCRVGGPGRTSNILIPAVAPKVGGVRLFFGPKLRNLKIFPAFKQRWYYFSTTNYRKTIIHNNPMKKLIALFALVVFAGAVASAQTTSTTEKATTETKAASCSKDKAACCKSGAQASASCSQEGKTSAACCKDGAKATSCTSSAQAGSCCAKDGAKAADATKAEASTKAKPVATKVVNTSSATAIGDRN